VVAEKGDMTMDYWTEHADIAISEAGLTATKAQLDIIAGVIEGAHDHYGQAMGHDVATSNFVGAQERERKDALRQLEEEKDKEIHLTEKALKLAREERERMQWALHDARREITRLNQQ